MNHSNPEQNKQIGYMLKVARLKQNVTQKQMAEHIGISMNQISCIETGRCKTSIDVLLGYCEILHVTPNMILGFKETPCESCYKLNSIRKIIDS